MARRAKCSFNGWRADIAQCAEGWRYAHLALACSGNIQARILTDNRHRRGTFSARLLYFHEGQRSVLYYILLSCRGRQFASMTYSGSFDLP